jgi:hypothetical protein
MKTILIPTYFDDQSFTELQQIVENSPNEKFNFIFFHAYKLTDSISDLLMLSRRTTEYGQIPEQFHKSCYDFKANNDNVTSIRIEYFYGNTIAAFRNFVEANEITEVYFPKNYKFSQISKHSLDPSILLAKCKIPTYQPAPLQIRKIEEQVSMAM